MHSADCPAGRSGWAKIRGAENWIKQERAVLRASTCPMVASSRRLAPEKQGSQIEPRLLMGRGVPNDFTSVDFSLQKWALRREGGMTGRHSAEGLWRQRRERRPGSAWKAGKNRACCGRLRRSA